MNMYLIYALVDPRNGDIRYVGFTHNVEQRYYTHCLASDSTSSSCEWLRQISPIKPDLHILEDDIHGKAEAYERETFWMNELLNAGEPLVNYVAPCRRKVS